MKTINVEDRGPRASLALLAMAILMLASCGGTANAAAESCTDYLGLGQADREQIVSELGAEHGWTMASNPLGGFRTVDAICSNSTGLAPSQIIADLACDEGNCQTRDAQEAQVAADGGFIGSGFAVNGVEISADRADTACTWFTSGTLAQPNETSVFGAPDRIGEFWDNSLDDTERADFGDIGQFAEFLNHVLSNRCQAGDFRFIPGRIANIYTQVNEGVATASGRVFLLDDIEAWCEVRDTDKWLTIPMLRSKDQVLARWEAEQDSQAEAHLGDFGNWIFFLNSVAARSCPEYAFSDDGTPMPGPAVIDLLVIEDIPNGEVLSVDETSVTVQLGFAPGEDGFRNRSFSDALTDAVENFSPMDADLVVEIVARADQGIEPDAEALARARALEVDQSIRRPVAGTKVEVFSRTEVIATDRGGVHAADARSATVRIFQRGTQEPAFDGTDVDLAGFVGAWGNWVGGTPVDVTLALSNGALIGTIEWPQFPCIGSLEQTGTHGDRVVFEASFEDDRHCNTGGAYFVGLNGPNELTYSWSEDGSPQPAWSVLDKE